MNMQLTFLGTGTSQGIPLVGCDCPVCQSTDPHDKRFRTSALLEMNGRNILVDASPELRLQCLQNNIRRMDACLITHTHADHILGMDDLRRFNQMQRQPIPIYAAAEHMETIEKVFGYARADRSKNNLDLPQFLFCPFEWGKPFDLFGTKILPLGIPHGKATVTVYRIQNFAYATDISEVPDGFCEQLKGLDTLVLGALRHKPHPSHLTFDQSVALAQKINARQTWLVHMSHEILHTRENGILPENIRLAHDGLKVNIQT